MKLSIWLLAALALSLFACFGFDRGGSVRELRELGRVTLPKRLETRNPKETATHAEFVFERASGSFFDIGSYTPLVERLAIGVWRTAADGHDATVETVLYHMPHSRIQWRKEGECTIGEGVQEINAQSYPVWVVVRDAPERQLTVAYMVWKREMPLEKARALVDAVLQSFAPGRPAGEYLAAAGARAARDEQ